MTKPISFDRKKWIIERAQVLDLMRNELSNRLHQYSGPGQNGSVQRDLQLALQHVNVELNMLSAELKVLNDFGVTE